MSNFPPGVTGSEPHIAGDSTWETWAEDLQRGDQCLVTWHGVTFDGRYLQVVPGGAVDVEIVAAAGVLVRVRVSWEDLEPPEAS